MLQKVLLFLLSPTRTIIDCLKRRDTRWLKPWRLSFGVLALLSIPAISLLKPQRLLWPLPYRLWYLAVILWLWPWSRVTEIVWAFPYDALSQLKGSGSSTRATPGTRLLYLLISYLEVAINFGVLYYFLPDGMFRNSTGKATFDNIFQAVYLSMVTITTTGYGDITPQRPVSQVLCMAEMVVGIVLVVFAAGAYISAIKTQE